MIARRADRAIMVGNHVPTMMGMGAEMAAAAQPGRTDPTPVEVTTAWA